MSATLTVPSLSLTTVGAMTLVLNGAPKPLSSKKAVAILTYLALQEQPTESRERISALLWSDNDQAGARAALRQTVRRLKLDLAEFEDILDADRSNLRLTAPIKVEILEAIAEAEAGEAPGMLRRDNVDLSRLLSDLEDLDSDLNHWISVQRERLTGQLVTALDTAMRAKKDTPDVLPIAEAILATDPTHEAACRAAMRAHVAKGDIIGAMKRYERLWEVLDEDFDIEPSPQTQDLYVSIKQGGVDGDRPDAVPKVEPEGEDGVNPAIPVAIMVDPPMAGQLPPEFDYFTVIFRSELIAALTRFRAWLIVDSQDEQPAPRTTFRSYRLKVATMSMQGALIVSLMLVDQQDGRCIWAERKEVALDDMGALHQWAVRHLAVALNVHLSASRRLSAKEMETPAGRNYERWMQAQALMNEWRPESERKAEKLLREVISANPEFAPAQITLAEILNASPVIFPGQVHTESQTGESLALTSRAVQLDPLDSRAHLCRAWSHAVSGGYGASLSHLDLALDLNSNDPWTIISSALMFAFNNEMDRARALMDQAIIFAPRVSRGAQGYIATTKYLIGDYQEAASVAEMAGDAIVNLPAWRAAALARMGKADAAMEAVDLFYQLCKTHWIVPGVVPTESEA
ncbi:MAG: BTAD domain-containing putative transcriptional regulator, partial [Pseudomonadota bacterium]